MAAALPSPPFPEPRRFPIRLPRRVSISIAVATGAVIILGCLAWMLRVPGRQFDRKLWSETGDEKQGAQYPRLEMADRLVAERRLRGKTRGEVVEMLGEPPETSYFRDGDLVYWLGPERGLFSIDSEWLVFRLDTQGRISEYRIVRD